MGIAAFYAIEELLNEYNLYFYLESEVLNIGKPFDYALVDEVKGKVVTLVEVKRLSSLEDLPNYVKGFMGKAKSIYEVCNYVILHLHATPEVIRDERTRKLLEGFKEAVNTALNSLTNIKVITTHINENRFNTFKNTLTSEIEQLLAKRKD